MKQLAIIFNRILVGGAEKSLLNLLDAIDREKYGITLFTYDNSSPYLDVLPEGVRVEYTATDVAQRSLGDALKHLRIGTFLKGIYFRAMIRLCRDPYKQMCYNMRCLPKFKQQFDCAISYKLNYEDTATALWRIRAKKKCVIAHSSVGTKETQTSCYVSQVCKRFHRIFCVSRTLSQAVRDICPRQAEKIGVLHNIVPYKEIQQQAQAPMPETFARNAIVTVGRLSSEKGQDMVPHAVRLLLDKGHDVHWYLVGDGPLRQEIQQKIDDHAVSDHVHLLGTKSNPYPYIKNCDIYVQTSHSEGWCLTTQEAKVLCKPIVTTNLPVMYEQFTSGKNGLIVDAVTPEALADGIAYLLEHPSCSREFSANLQNDTDDHAQELQILYDFIGSSSLS